jgi:hypothetical protein
LDARTYSEKRATRAVRERERERERERDLLGNNVHDGGVHRPRLTGSKRPDGQRRRKKSNRGQ